MSVGLRVPCPNSRNKPAHCVPLGLRHLWSAHALLLTWVSAQVEDGQYAAFEGLKQLWALVLAIQGPPAPRAGSIEVTPHHFGFHAATIASGRLSRRSRLQSRLKLHPRPRSERAQEHTRLLVADVGSVEPSGHPGLSAGKPAFYAASSALRGVQVGRLPVPLLRPQRSLGLCLSSTISCPTAWAVQTPRTTWSHRVGAVTATRVLSGVLALSRPE